MSIDGANVVETKLLEQGGRNDHALGVLFKATGKFEQRGYFGEHFAPRIFGGGIKLAAEQLSQITIQRSNRGRNRHVVVIEDDQQVAIFHTPMVERLEGHARRHGAIAYDRYTASIFTLQPGSHGHA